MLIVFSYISLEEFNLIIYIYGMMSGVLKDPVLCNQLPILCFICLFLEMSESMKSTKDSGIFLSEMKPIIGGEYSPICNYVTIIYIYHQKFIICRFGCISIG